MYANQISDDIIFRYQHLIGYIEETKLLQQLLPREEAANYGIGFLRYRRIMRKEGDVHSAHWDSNDVLEQDNLEELPGLYPICLNAIPYIRVDGNTHQGMWILNRNQIDVLDKKCEFLNQSWASR
jgi:hypothetical protein